MLLTFALLAGAVLVQDSDGPTPEERKELFQLLNIIDLRNVKDLPFVRVSTGWGSWDDEGQRQPTFISGFLLRDDGSRFTVVWPNLDWSAFTRKDSPKPFERVFHESQDFKTFVREFTRRRADPEGNVCGSFGFRFCEGMCAPEYRTLVMVRHCLQKGLKEEAEELWKYAGAPTATWRSAFAERLVLAFAEPARNRAELLDLHRKWLAAYPKSEEFAEVEERAAILERMVQEDKDWKPPAAPAKEDEIKSLVRALRDECWDVPIREYLNLMRDSPVASDAPRPPPGSTTSERLIELGIDAAPALIVALGDKRLTRSVSVGGWRSPWDGRHYVRSVAQLATEILMQISGFSFHSSEVEECRDYWESWRRGVVREGEEAYLTGVVASGGEDGMYAAARLIKKWPRRFPSVIEAIRASDHEIFRHDMLQRLSSVTDEKVTEFFLEVFEKPQRDSERVDMARMLLRRGRQEAVAGMLKHWKGKLTNIKSELEASAKERDSERRWIVHRWRNDAEFLLESGDSEARSAVLRNLASQPTLIRQAVLDAISRLSAKELFGGVEPEKKESVEREVEDALVAFVDETPSMVGALWLDSIDDGTVEALNPSHAKLAAATLHYLWPDDYPFMEGIPTRARRPVVLEKYNVRRDKAGLPTREVPKMRSSQSKDPETPKRVEQLLTSPDRDVRRKLADELTREGLGAVGSIQEALAKAQADQPGRVDLETLANRLANIVSEAKLESGSWRAPPELAKAVAALVGRLAEPKSLTGLVEQSLKALPDMLGDVKMVVDRLGDGSGIHVLLSIKPGTRAKESKDRTVRAIDLPRRMKSSSGWTSASDGAHTLIELSAWGELETALQASHQESMEVMIRIRRD